MNWFLKLFRKDIPEDIVQQTIRVPKPNEKWIMNIDGDPFPSKYLPVQILDVKEGWVRYNMGTVFTTDERRTVKSFINMYQLYEEIEQ